jgi:hypothetical protein
VTLDEQIAKLVNKTIADFWGSAISTEDAGKALCYAAIAAFCEREPSEKMLKASGITWDTAERVYRAMLAVARDELKGEGK